MSQDAESVKSRSGSSQPRWQFIDSSKNSRSNLTQVKRHVMHEYMRQKRQSGSHDPIDDESDGDEGHKSHQLRPRARKPRTAAAARGTAKSAKMKGPDGGHQKPFQPRPAPQYTESADQSISSEDSVDEVVPTQIGHTSTIIPIIEPSSRETLLQLDSFSWPSDPFSRSTSSDSSTQSDTSLVPSSSARTSPFALGLSPKSMLSAARTDPFNSLPMDLDMEGQRLFDFYVNEMPACSYGSHFRSPKAHNWYTMVFVPEGMKGAVAFQNTILVHAANTWAWVRKEEETDYTLEHRNRAITMLREHMAQHPGDTSDVAIIACLSAAGLEDFDPRPGRKQISWIHMRAAREMIRARGGPAAFENTRLGMLINWQDYILSGYETKGPSFFFEPVPSITQPSLSQHDIHHPIISQPSDSLPSPPSSISSEKRPSQSPPDHPPLIQPTLLSPKDEIQHQCNEFIEFLKRCEQLALYQRSQSDELTVAPSRRSAFQPTSLLYEILTAPPGMRFTATGDRKQFVARFVALIMLNAGLWDYRFSAPYTQAFISTLERALLESEVSASGSVEALLQILLECNDGAVRSPSGSPPLALASSLEELPVADFSQYVPTAQTPYRRPWFAGRMLKVAKRLSRESWMNVHDFLFSCLALRVETPTVLFWEGGLRKEVLSAPLTSYVMPALEV